MKIFRHLIVALTFVLYGFSISTKISKTKLSSKVVAKNIKKYDNIRIKNSDQEKLGDKYLITNTSVGYFKLNGNWKALAKKEYNYQSIKGYANCFDACCDGGVYLGNNMVKNEYGIVENPHLTIGTYLYESGDPWKHKKMQFKYKNRSDLFYVASDNCIGWYLYDKIKYINISSDKFKTKEGVGVGTTLKEFENIFGKFVVESGFVEEQDNPLQIHVESYPNIGFIIDVNDCKRNPEEISGEILTISDFKKGAKISGLIIENASKLPINIEKELHRSEILAKYEHSDYVKIIEEISTAFDKWLTKEEFEKTEDYNERLKQSKVVFDSVCYATFNNKLKEKSKINVKIELGAYNADKELFSYELKINEIVINDSLKVPTDQAENFKNKIKNLKILKPSSGSFWAFVKNNLTPIRLKFDETKIVLQLPKDLVANKLKIDVSELKLNNIVNEITFDYELYETKQNEIRDFNFNRMIELANEFESKKDLISCVSNLEKALKIKKSKEVIQRVEKLKETIHSIQLKNSELSELNDQIKIEYSEAILISNTNLNLLKGKNKKAAVNYELAYNLLKQKCDQFESILSNATISKDDIEWSDTHEMLLQKLKKKRESLNQLSLFDSKIYKLIQKDEIKIIKKIEIPEELIEAIASSQIND